MLRSILILMLMFMMIDARASIEYDGEDGNPTSHELERNRMCFEELDKNGCGDPGANLPQFRSCLHDAFPQLTESCRKMMSDLYRRRK